jgi:hypothetical protein
MNRLRKTMKIFSQVRELLNLNFLNAEQEH